MVFVVMLALAGTPGILLGQQPDESPKPAARAYPPLGEISPDQGQSNPQVLTPDTRSLTGAQSPTLGSAEMGHSYWVPGFEYGDFLPSSSTLDRTVTDWNSTSFIAGNLSLVESWRHAALNLNYSGGGYFSTDNAIGNGQFHQLGVLHESDWGKWQLAFIDQFSYLPQTQFGFGAGTNLALPGIGGDLGAQLSGLQISYVPSQSIYSAIGPRYSNAFVTQIGYSISRRSRLTLAGSYGVLHFTEPGSIDTYDAVLGAGYSFELSRYDTVGVVYRFTAYHFTDSPEAFGDHTVQLAYGRKITGRLAMQLFGGPEITEFRVPLGTSTRRVTGAGAANLTYGVSEQTSLSLGYTHGMSGGSGVLTGAVTDQIEGSLDHQLSRLWRGGVHFGYARNTSLAQSGSQNFPNFDNWYAGANLERPIGRSMHVNFAYTANIESSNLPISTIGVPKTSFTMHQITLEFGWHARPLVIR